MHPSFRNKQSAYYEKYPNAYSSLNFDYCLVKIHPVDVERINRNSPLPGVTKVAIAKLAETHVPFSVGVGTETISDAKCHVVGWGQVETGGQSPVLRDAKVDVMSQLYCNQLGRNITSRRIKRTYTRVADTFSFCAGRGGADACEGDSGGPLFCEINSERIQFGVVSHGPPGGRCGRTNRPGIYSNVPYALAWIRNVTQSTYYCIITTITVINVLVVYFVIFYHVFSTYYVQCNCFGSY